MHLQSCSTFTITTSKGDNMAGIPYNDNSPAPAPGNSGQSPAPPSSGSTSSTNKGTIDDPVRLGTAFTYTDRYNYSDLDHYSAKYTVTITKVTPISRDEIEKLGFQRPENNPLIDYVMVDMDLVVENATFKKGTNSIGYMYLSDYQPDVWGIKTKSGNSLIGGRTFGFDGSLLSNAREKLSDYPKVTDGDSKSYSVSGKILLPILNGEESFLVLKMLDSNLDYDDSFIYFKLQ